MDDQHLPPAPLARAVERAISRRRLLRGAAIGGAFLAATPILAACGDDDDDDGASSGGTDTTAAGSTETTAGGSAPAGDAADFKVAFAYVGPTADNGWTFEHDRGRQEMEAALGVTTSFVENVPFGPEATQTFTQLGEENDVVIVNSEYGDLLRPAIEANPDTIFFECNGHLTGEYDNYVAYYIAHEGLAYVMGVAAGHLSARGKLGYVGAFPTATVYNDTNCFLLGAQTVNPDATMQVVMINSFFDPPNATQAAQALVDDGCDVLFDVQDDTSVLQVAEQSGVWSCIWNRNNGEFGPDAYVNSLQLNFGPYYTEAVGAILGGSFTVPSEVTLLGVGEGIDLGGWGANVPDDAKAAGEAAYAEVVGGFTPYTGPLAGADGSEVLAAGETLDALGAYNVDFSIEGVTGVS